MRRQLALIAIFLLLPLAACGGRTDDTTAAAPPAEATTPSTVAAAPTAQPLPEPPAPRQMYKAMLRTTRDQRGRPPK